MKKKELQKKVHELTRGNSILQETIAVKDWYQLYVTQENDQLKTQNNALMLTLAEQDKLLEKYKHMYEVSENVRKRVTEEVYELRGKVKSLENELQYYKDFCDSEALYEKAKMKHGHWIDKYDYVCSVCGYASEYIYKYCPECGAKMDEEVKENEAE